MSAGDPKDILHPCQYCTKEIPHWRSNKIYCDEECKYKHFNEQQKSANLEMGRVNKILKKNFEILKKVIKAEKYAKISRRELERKGFNFDFMTHIKGEYRNCYLLSWRPVEKDNIIVSRTPESTFTENR